MPTNGLRLQIQEFVSQQEYVVLYLMSTNGAEQWILREFAQNEYGTLENSGFYI